MRAFHIVATMMFATALQARAGELIVSIDDGHGHPAADAVVSLRKEGAAEPAPRAAVTRIIDQRHETFIPYVEIFRPGRRRSCSATAIARAITSIRFRAAKSFEFVIAPGDSAPPVTLDQRRRDLGRLQHPRPDDHAPVRFGRAVDRTLGARTAARCSRACRRAPTPCDVWHPQLRPGRAGPQPGDCRRRCADDRRHSRCSCCPIRARRGDRERATERAMSFRLRLSLLFVATLVAVQVFTALLVYGVARRAFIAEGERQLSAGAAAVARQLDDISASRRRQRAGACARLRAARGDRAARSEHGAVGVAQPRPPHRRGAHAADRPRRRDPLRHVEYSARRARSFRFRILPTLRSIIPAAAVVAMEGKAYWMIVVPVLRAGTDRADRRRHSGRRSAAAAPAAVVGVAEHDRARHRCRRRTLDRCRARRATRVALAAALMAAGHALPLQPTLVRVRWPRIRRAGRRACANRRRSAPVAVVLGYSLDDALRPYRSVALAWASLVALGLAAGLVGAMLIARSVAHPIETLAATAHRIESGDYSAARPTARQRGEIGQLAAAFTNMTHAIARTRGTHPPSGAARCGDRTCPTARPPRRRSQALATRAGRARRAADGRPRAPARDHPDDGPFDLRSLDARRRQSACASSRRADSSRARPTRSSRCGSTAPARPTRSRSRSASSMRSARPIREADLSIDTAPAIGIALCPQHGSEASALLRRAEVALIAALDSDRSRRSLRSDDRPASARSA